MKSVNIIQNRRWRLVVNKLGLWLTNFGLIYFQKILGTRYPGQTTHTRYPNLSRVTSHCLLRHHLHPLHRAHDPLSSSPLWWEFKSPKGHYYYYHASILGAHTRTCVDHQNMPNHHTSSTWRQLLVGVCDKVNTEIMYISPGWCAKAEMPIVATSSVRSPGIWGRSGRRWLFPIKWNEHWNTLHK